MTPDPLFSIPFLKVDKAVEMQPRSSAQEPKEGLLLLPTPSLTPEGGVGGKSLYSCFDKTGWMTLRHNVSSIARCEL